MDRTNNKKIEAVCPGKKLDLQEVRERLSNVTGPRYWRTLEELTQSDGFEELLHREFPRGASEWLDPVSRRGFLKLMGASMALAGLGACVKQPLEPIVPYVRQPEEIIPGKPLFFASAFPLSGYAVPILVESHEGRPTKIEGNPEHPASLGGTDAYTQASILTLYDPDRSPTNTYLGDVRPFPAFQTAIRGPLIAQRAVGGSGLRFLTPTVSSPTLAGQLVSLLQRYPSAKWHQWEPVNRDSARNGSQMAFGMMLDTHYLLDKADVILSLDADFLFGGFPGFVRYARDYAMRRRPDDRPMNRLYVIEGSPTTTGGKADHRLPVRASEIEQYTRAVASGLGINAGGRVNNDHDQKWITALVKDLQAHKGKCVVIPGDTQPPIVHALAHAMNDALGNVGQTLAYADPVEVNPVDQGASIKELVADLNAGQVDLLVIVGGNPVYDAPAELDFANAMGKALLRVHLGLYQNETAAHCQWHVNEAYYLEGWSDARAYDGTASVIQPLIAPLYNGRTAHEFLAAFTDQPEATAYDLVRGYWMTQHTGPDFEQWWRKSVHDGFMEGTALPPKQVKLTMTSFAPPAQASTQPATGELEIVFRRDPSIYDGCFSNNAWLQELPKPMNQVTWGNPIMISPATAQRLNLKGEDLVDLELNGRHVEAAVWVQPGHPDDSITAQLGYGRTNAGRAGTAVGFSAYRLRTGDAPWFARGLRMSKTGSGFPLASIQGSQMIQGRHMVRSASLEEYQKDPEFASKVEFTPPRALTLYPNYEYTGYAWGMEIDLNSCVGCNACIVACVSENNIPVVGKTEVLRGRHMHWLRVDNYYEGDMANPRMFFQPVPCMQCENAPCELVCPVGATVHTTEGLNDQVYNRCVGTRYCSNNCPYKVRRFNFLLFQDWNTPQFKMMRNPEVTVRSRGVMEKCTYCVQRITKGRIKAEEEDRLVRDGEVRTACQQACPADAIVFGDINDRNSRVTALKANPRNYGMLADLNTRPRTTYMAAVRNPNPEVPEQ